MDPDLIGVTAAFVVVIGTAAIAARFVFKGIADSVIRLRESKRAVPGLENEELRMLQHDVADLKNTVEQLRDVVEFDRQLQPGSTPPTK